MKAKGLDALVSAAAAGSQSPDGDGNAAEASTAAATSSTSSQQQQQQQQQLLQQLLKSHAAPAAAGSASTATSAAQAAALLGGLHPPLHAGSAAASTTSNNGNPLLAQIQQQLASQQLLQLLLQQRSAAATGGANNGNASALFDPSAHKLQAALAQLGMQQQSKMDDRTNPTLAPATSTSSLAAALGTMPSPQGPVGLYGPAATTANVVAKSPSRPSATSDNAVRKPQPAAVNIAPAPVAAGAVVVMSDDGYGAAAAANHGSGGGLQNQQHNSSSSGNHNYLGFGGGGGGDKKLLKRAANRKSAQLSRKRKKQLMEELKDENDDLRRKEQILKSIPDLIVVFDSTGKLWFVSESVSNFLKFSARELEGSSIWDRLCKDSVRLLKAAFMDSLAARQPGSSTAPLGQGFWELRLMDRDGEHKIVTLNGVVHFAGERPECVCSIRPADETAKPADAAADNETEKDPHYGSLIRVKPYQSVVSNGSSDSSSSENHRQQHHHHHHHHHHLKSDKDAVRISDSGNSGSSSVNSGSEGEETGSGDE